MENDKRDVIDWLNDMANDEEWPCYYSDSELRMLAKDALELLKVRKVKWIHREDMDFKDKNNHTHYYGMCTNCGFIHDFIDGHTGQYLYCPQCGMVIKWE